MRLMKSGKEEVIMQGEIHKFHPGIQKDFVPRWVVLTTHGLKYFENEYRARKSLAGIGNPIMAVPLEAIDDVRSIGDDQFEM